MTNKKYQIFISSTFRDLADERQDSIRNVLDLKHIPAGMELFPAADVEQLEYIKRVIDECDYYLLIIGGRYGSVDAEGVSFTEREYDYAVESEKVVLAFVHNDPASIPIGNSEVTQAAIDALNAFRLKVMSGRLVKMWVSRQDLEPLVLKALIHAFNDFPQTGWIRGDALASEELVSQSNKALQENAELKQLIAAMETKVQPKFDDLADFDDMFVIRYKAGQYSAGKEITLSWRTIFIGVAGLLEKPKTDSVIESGLDLILKDRGKDVSRSINGTDRIRIKAQLIALGVIQSRVSKTTRGGQEEFLSLTKAGQQAFLENIVVKKADKKVI
ncbi:DUF4062 domain-containing protein [Yoonia sp.]|uniref:DUF4062 domain-containing protein n=1 Tax=Yoonia sp. TaxID=2212373 RepID=UPI00238E8601|nr:DUF4062 domain-containing protein [Yoonia sp.]MDE0852249.1 DUF4062 domain-containing protein [Yoonia sp.]